VNPHQSVFRDETKLDINYIPGKMPHREKEYRLLMEFFSFVLRNPDKMAQRVIVTGDVGTGKTALAQRFGEDISLEANKIGSKIKYVHVNTREYRGKLSLVLQQVIAVFQPNFPKRGYAAEEQLTVLLKILDEEKTHLVLALDEFDSLIEQEGSESVYQLTRLQEARSNQPQRVSLLCILRDLKATEHLDASSKSTLQHNIINLEKYSSRQLIDILGDRVRLAFQQGTVSEDVLSLAAELSSNESGNARFAIELLWRAGKYADAEELEEVIPECVRKAVSSIIPTIRRSELTGLELHEKLFLLGVAKVFKTNQNVYATLSEVEKEYALVCENFNIQPNGHTQLWKYVQFLSKLGVLKSQIVVAGPRGRTTQLSLPAISASELEKAIEDSIDSQSVISNAD
jgi:cell division control protein 6